MENFLNWSNRQMGGLFCDTADREPIVTVIAHPAGVASCGCVGSNIIEKQEPCIACTTLRTAPVITSNATSSGQYTIIIDPVAGRRKHQLISEFYTRAVVGGSISTTESAHTGFGIVSYHPVPLGTCRNPVTRRTRIVGRFGAVGPGTVCCSCRIPATYSCIVGLR